MTLARAEGRYVAVDAAGCCRSFMVATIARRGAFKACSSYLEPAARSRVRIFGEMVSLLVADGNADGALALEALWNELQKSAVFAAVRLPDGAIRRRGARVAAVDTCAEHSRVVPAESYSALDDGDARLRKSPRCSRRPPRSSVEIAEHKRTQAQLRSRWRPSAPPATPPKPPCGRGKNSCRSPRTSCARRSPCSVRRRSCRCGGWSATGQLEPERVVQALRTVGSQARKLSRLVGQLLDISRLDSGKLTIEPEPTDLVAAGRAGSRRRVGR